MATEALPLAIPMVVGPALIAAIVLASDPRSIRSSLAYAIGIGASTALGTAIAIGLVALVEIEVGDASDAGSAGTIIQLILAGILIAIALRRRLRQRVAQPPAWLETVGSMTPGRALKTGLAIVPLLPCDLIIIFTVAVNVEHHRGSFASALPFVGLTTVLAVLPLLASVALRRARAAMPRARALVESWGWLVQIAAYAGFVLLIV
jgi:hypothetical protein